MEIENQILLQLGEIKGQISGFLARIEKVEAYDGRLRKLEESKMFVWGVASALSAVISTAGYLIHG